jgi:hypothetical protein
MNESSGCQCQMAEFRITFFQFGFDASNRSAGFYGRGAGNRADQHGFADGFADGFVALDIHESLEKLPNRFSTDINIVMDFPGSI